MILQLMLVYSDGTVRLIRQGFDVDPFRHGSTGIYPMTIHYEGLTVSYDVAVIACPVGITHDWVFQMDTVLYPIQ